MNFGAIRGEAGPVTMEAIRRMNQNMEILTRTVSEAVQNGVLVVNHSELNQLDFLSAGHTGFVPSTRQVLAGTGLTGGGTLGVDRTLSLSTDSQQMRRGTLLFSWFAAMTTATDLGVGSVQLLSTLGVNMLRPGSIIGVGCTVNVSIFTGNAAPTIQVTKNGTPVFSKSVAINSAAVFYDRATQAVGTDTFVAGDYLGAYIDINPAAGNTINKVIAHVEVEYDT